MIGRLERTWHGGGTIGELCMILISNSQDRPDLDFCRVDLRWRMMKESSMPEDS
jgi:hypothetical protein